MEFSCVDIAIFWFDDDTALVRIRSVQGGTTSRRSRSVLLVGGDSIIHDLVRQHVTTLFPIIVGIDERSWENNMAKSHDESTTDDDRVGDVFCIGGLVWCRLLTPHVDRTRPTC